jgi:prevent-host-death family protein
MKVIPTDLPFGSPPLANRLDPVTDVPALGLTHRMSATKVALMKTELVTTLKRQATKLIARLQEKKAPILITQYGKPAAYLVDVGSYENMTRRISVLEGLAQGERDVRQGRVVTQAEAKRRMARWLS